MDNKTRTYWQQRAFEERERAQTSRDDAVRTVHAEMADLYERCLRPPIVME